MGFVAPYVGAWIETKALSRVKPNVSSHPTWVRGLKQTEGLKDVNVNLSHPTWVRGLKLISHNKKD